MNNPSLQIQIRESMGNLHLRLEGVFDESFALILSAILWERHPECRRLFIDTDGLQRVEPFGADLFRSFLRGFFEVSQCVYFKGKNGAQIALDGQRVLQMKQHYGCGCTGQCKICKCAKRKKLRGAATSGNNS